MTYLKKNIQIMSVWLSELSQSEHTHVTSARPRRRTSALEKPQGPPLTWLFPFPHAHFCLFSMSIKWNYLTYSFMLNFSTAQGIHTVCNSSFTVCAQMTNHPGWEREPHRQSVGFPQTEDSKLHHPLSPRPDTGWTKASSIHRGGQNNSLRLSDH